MADFEMNITGVKEVQKMLDPKVVKQATARTINDMTKTSVVQTTKAILQRYAITAARVKGGKKAGVVTKGGMNIVFKANKSKLFGIIRVSAKTLSLASFTYKYTPAQRLKTKTKPATTTVTIRKGRKTKLEGAFKMQGIKPVFLRGEYGGGGFKQGKGLVAGKGPSILGMFNAVQGIRRINIILRRRMDKVFWRHYNRAIEIAKGRG